MDPSCLQKSIWSWSTGFFSLLIGLNCVIYLFCVLDIWRLFLSEYQPLPYLCNSIYNFVYVFIVSIFIAYHNKNLSTREEMTLLHVNNKGADQPAHLQSLISTLFIYYLAFAIAKQTTCKVSTFKLVSKLGRLVWALHGCEPLGHIWASPRENLSSGLPTKWDSNQSPQLQR